MRVTSRLATRLTVVVTVALGASLCAGVGAAAGTDAGMNAGAARADQPSVPLVVNLNLVVNFAYMTDSPDLVLSLERINDEGYTWAATSKISAADVKMNKADYGGSDVERREDLAASHHIFTRFFSDEDEHVGGTVLMASREVFDELLSKGATSIDIVDIPGEKGMTFTPGVIYERKNFRGTLQKIGIESQRIIVDGEPEMVRVLHAKGRLTARELTRDYEFWWANDPASRLLLHYKSEDYVEFRVVRIDYPDRGEGGPQKGKMEGELSGNGSGGGGFGDLMGKSASDGGKLKKRAVLPPGEDAKGGEEKKVCRAPANGLYFATGSAEILAPSRPALDRIAGLLKKHADWKVTIEGHTDNVGGDESNLTLSRNRAAAVKTELTGGYGIDRDRIQTEGYGRKRPVDTNDTVEGRAHNRRVEVSRICR